MEGLANDSLKHDLRLVEYEVPLEEIRQLLVADGVGVSLPPLILS